MDLTFLLPLVYFIVVILVTWVAARFVSGLLGRLTNQTIPMVASQVKQIGWILIWLVGLILAIGVLGVNSEILLLITGLFGIGVIVTLRDPLENIGSKYFSDVYIPFNVGDTIFIQSHLGKVVEINPISTVILDKDYNLVSIPNTILMNEVVVNTTPQAWRKVNIPIVIGNDVDFPVFESEVLKSVSKLRLHLDKRFPPVITRSQEAQSTELTLALTILRPEDRDTMVAEVNKRITAIIDAMGKSSR